MKIVINKCYGGFALSDEAMTEINALRMAKHKIIELHDDDEFGGVGEDIARNDPILIAVVEKLGTKADGDYAKLHIIEIPDGIDWEIGEYDGSEWVQEKHRTWS
jgi:hypothetical protein